MNRGDDARTKTLGRVPLAVGVLSFIPVFGLFFGSIAVLWGVGSDKGNGKTLAILGASGIVVANFLLFFLFFLVIELHGGILDRLVTVFTQAGVDALVEPIELHKEKFGTYPDSLSALQKAQTQGIILTILDPTNVKISRKLTDYYYQRTVDGHYFLRSLGIDGRPFTADDVVPRVSDVAGKRPGLLID